MLILTRKESESIRIGQDVKITMLQVGSQDVRIGIEAPRDIAVHRSEIYEKIKAEKTKA